MDVQKFVEFLQSYPTWAKAVAVSCQAVFIGVLVFAPRITVGEFVFWSRTKTGTNGRLARHAFGTLARCTEAAQAFEPKRLLLAGCGCTDRQPSKEELINQYLLGDDTAGEMARVLGFNVPAREEAPTQLPQTKGDWRFWFVNNNTLLDEMFGSREECLKYQRAWDHQRSGPIVFPCAEVNETLLSTAGERRASGVEFAGKWYEMIENALKLKRENQS